MPLGVRPLIGSSSFEKLQEKNPIERKASEINYADHSITTGFTWTISRNTSEAKLRRYALGFIKGEGPGESGLAGIQGNYDTVTLDEFITGTGIDEEDATRLFNGASQVASETAIDLIIQLDNADGTLDGVIKKQGNTMLQGNYAPVATTGSDVYRIEAQKLMRSQHSDPTELDLNLNKAGLNREESLVEFAQLIHDFGDTQGITNDKLKLVGLNNQGIKGILNGEDITTTEEMTLQLDLLDQLDGNPDGIIRKSTIAALNRGEIIATSYIPSDITAADGQPEGFDEKPPALTAAKAFIKDKGCTDDTTEIQRQDIANILFPGLVLRADALGDELDEDTVNKVIDGFIKKYGKNGKITGAQAAEGLVDLDQQGNTSNCCKTYDGIINSKHLDALIADKPETPEENNNNGNNGNAGTNNGGNTTPPSNNAVNNVYTPPTATSDLKDDVEAVKQQHTKKSGGLFGNLFGGGLGKTLGLAAIITGFFMMMKNNKQSTSQYTPNYYAGGYNPYPQGGQAINGMGGMMNIFG